MVKKPMFDSIHRRLALLLAYGASLAIAGCITRPPKFKYQPAPAREYKLPTVTAQVLAPSVAVEEPQLIASTSLREASVLNRDPTGLPNEFHELTLDAALAMAIGHASVIPDLGGTIVRAPRSAATAFDPMILDSDPFLGTVGTLSQFDPRWFGQVSHANNDRVFNNATIGGGATELQQDLVIGRSGISRRTWSGGQWEIAQSATHDGNNRVGNLFANTWEQNLDLSFRQPLLRGSGRAFNAIAGPDARPGMNFSHGVWVAQVRADVSRVEFAQRLQEYLVSVEDAYWNLHMAYQRYMALESSVRLAEEVHSQVLARYNSEIEGGEADREAEARFVLIRFRQQRQQALVGSNGTSGIYSSEFALRRLIGLPSQSSDLLRPVTPLPDAPMVYDVDSDLRSALYRRLELQQQRLRVKEQEMKLVAAVNFTRPQVDVISRYRMRGFGDDWWGDGPRFQSALQDLASLEHQEWEFGLELNAPYHQRQARQGVQFARFEVAKAKSILAEQETTIEFAVQESILRVASGYESMSLAYAGLEASDQRLKATAALYAADRVPLHQIREAQEAWQQAVDAFEVSKVEYARSIRQVQVESGRYLQESQVEI